MSSLILILGALAGLAVLGAVAFALSRRSDRVLGPRLERIAEPLTGRETELDPEVDTAVFRTLQTRSGSGRLMRYIQARYPLIEAKRVFPRALTAGVVGAVGSWGAMWGLQIPSGWWTGPLVCLAGIGSTFHAMSWFHSRQVGEFTRQFPEVIDQIVRLSRAGVPPLEAIAVITEDTRPPVEPVLRNVCDGLLAGLDVDTALRAVSARVKLAEFTMFTAVISLQRRAGGSVSGAFANLSQALRDRRSTALKARASTAQTRLTLLVLSVMPILVLIGQKFISPQAVEFLFGTKDGNTLLHWGVGLIITGLLAARFIASRAEQ